MRTANPLKRHEIVTVTQQCRRIAGVTLPELIFTMAIIGILTSIAAPAFTDLMAAQRSKGVATDIYIALSKARSEAIKRNASITLTPKTGGWQAGWEIAHPTDAAAKLEDHNAITGITITGPSEVVYLSSGRVKGSTVPTFDISATGSLSHTCVTLNLSGLPTQKSSSC